MEERSFLFIFALILLSFDFVHSKNYEWHQVPKTAGPGEVITPVLCFKRKIVDLRKKDIYFRISHSKQPVAAEILDNFPEGMEVTKKFLQKNSDGVPFCYPTMMTLPIDLKPGKKIRVAVIRPRKRWFAFKYVTPRIKIGKEIISKESSWAKCRATVEGWCDKSENGDSGLRSPYRIYDRIKMKARWDDMFGSNKEK